VFTFEADSGIAGTAFTDKDTVVAAWGTLDAAGKRLVQHSGRGPSAAPFTWSAGVAPAPPTPATPTEAPTTTTPTTAAPTAAPTTTTPTTATPTAVPTTATPTNVTNTKAPTTGSYESCSDGAEVAIAACKMFPQSRCTPAQTTLCSWCPKYLGIDEGCYMTVYTGSGCQSTDTNQYTAGGGCPVNAAKVVGGILGLAMGVFIGIIGAHLKCVAASQRCDATPCCNAPFFRPQHPN
jgi:hypothetical protein